ncbi:MAG: hypothetical protein EOP20_01505 [Hyphomicrobiales bacterium]|nr:MAG: hypothetical protein EOP20_01505 [Hyphomicrobiales bacterium]
MISELPQLHRLSVPKELITISTRQEQFEGKRAAITVSEIASPEKQIARAVPGNLDTSVD